MHRLWEKSTGYNLLWLYSYACIWRSYSSIKVEGREQFPTDGPVIFASNHCCTMMDPLVLLYAFKSKVAFGARADIFRKPKANKALRWLRIVPLARERDGMSAVSGNQQIFEEIVECLDHQVPFCLYVEGTHRPQREIQRPIKKGVFRLAELAETETGKKIYIMPVGLTYGDFFRYMKPVKIRFGKPFPLDEVRDMNSKDRLELLGDRIQELVDTQEPVRNHGNILLRALLALILLPIFAVCAVLSSPILILTAIFLRNFKDPAWNNTVRFACSLIFFVLWPFHSVFYLILNYYQDLIEDIKR
ncbi:MAG: 1-acyl-sn-glycerol-3-phosphate acyltransferase [Bacteroidales bacterium]|nr:1-acyl-sn-glycerol-3-phosphate acyltransferase [Bacteroidales bacterium]